MAGRKSTDTDVETTENDTHEVANPNADDVQPDVVQDDGPGNMPPEPRPKLPDAVTADGQLRSEHDRVPEEISDEDRKAMIATPATSSYVTFPQRLREELVPTGAENHVTEIFDDDTGEKVDERPHWVQVSQVRTFPDGTVPLVTLRCECGQEYNVDWTADVVEEIVQVARR